ncbi:DUF551 domain-containing protein [Klebsiella pneumoniae]
MKTVGKTITRERLQELAEGQSGFNLRTATHEESQELARMALAAMDSEPDRNPVLAYADSYRDMAKQGVESVPIWSVITDLERNIAPLYRHAQPAVDSDFIPKNLDKALGVVGVAIPESREEFNLQAERWILRLIDRVIRYADEFQGQPAPVVPQDVLDALQKVARIRLDMNDFDGDRRGIADCLGDAEEALIEVVNRRAAMLHAGTLTNEGTIQAVNSPVIPGWIPVSEQMPPSRHEVLVGRWWGEKPRWCCKWATYIPGHPDAQSSGWLIPGASWTPTHWMPLPAAPQEPKP